MPYIYKCLIQIQVSARVEGHAFTVVALAKCRIQKCEMVTDPPQSQACTLTPIKGPAFAGWAPLAEAKCLEHLHAQASMEVRSHSFTSLLKHVKSGHQHQYYQQQQQQYKLTCITWAQASTTAQFGLRKLSIIIAIIIIIIKR
eukprot:1159940-Pelagomonas_calceolata.AAC.8